MADNLIETHIKENIAASEGEPFYVVDTKLIYEQYVAWQKVLPMIRPFYAIKCNTDDCMLNAMRVLGCGFDCASKEEIDRVLALGADPVKDMVFANPCKMPSHIQHAKATGVKRMTFDNTDELDKIAEYFPDAEMILRIATDDSHSLCRFSSKFGAHMEDVPAIIAHAKKVGTNLAGVAFHVGSGCSDPSSFEKAANDALRVFEMAKEQGFNMTVLDIGGGFFAADDSVAVLEEVAKYLVPALNKFPKGTQFAAEPGRYFATRSFTLATAIHSRRIIRDEKGEIANVLYYITEGCYHSFNCIFFDHQHPLPVTFDKSTEGLIPSTVFGPTCDSIDCICKDHPMPLLKLNDWVYFKNMGAYTIVALTHFNGFRGGVTRHYYWGEEKLDNVNEQLVNKIKEALKKN